MSNPQNGDLEFRQAQASTTPTDVLAKLASDLDMQVRKNVARNSNTPVEILAKLGEEFPDDITENPIFGILLLENPESRFVRLSLARSSTTDERTLVQLSKVMDESVLYAVAQNPNTPLSILEGFVQNPPLLYDDENADESDFDQIFIAIARNPQTTESLLAQLAEFGSSYVKIAIAENPKSPESLLDQFADWRNEQMHQAIARNPRTPASILEKLAGEDSSTTREMVKQHPNASDMVTAIIDFIEEKPGAPIELIEKLLASDRHILVRQLVAIHPKTPIFILEKLVRDASDIVALKAGSNPNATSTVLEAYAQFLVKQYGIVSPSNQGVYSRYAVNLVRNPNITSKVLEVLFEMDVYEVICEIAASSKTSPEILSTLADSNSKMHILRLLTKNPNTPAKALEALVGRISKSSDSMRVHALGEIASHPNTPESVLEELALYPRASLPATVAKNPRTSAECLRMLATDPNFGLLSEVAANENAPANLLLSCVVNKDESVRAGLAQNLKAPLALLETLAEDPSPFIRQILAQNPHLPMSVFNKLASDDDVDVRLKLAQNPGIPHEVIYYLSQDPILGVREGIALYPQLPLDLMQALCNSRNPKVRQLIAAQKDLPVDLEVQLSKDEYIEVRWQLLSKSDLSTVAIHNIIEEVFNQCLNALAVNRQKAFSLSENMLLEIARNLNTPASILEKIADNQPSELYEEFRDNLFWFIREAVAKNPNTPPSVLEKLASDGNGNVSSAARFALKARF